MSTVPNLERDAMSDPQPYPPEGVPEGEPGWEQDETDPPIRALPPHLKDVSSLASWSVSTHKPGCGVTALRDPSMDSYWQSDGPQPHYLNIHFFKLVSISHMRFYVDSKYDESYTPTKMQFLAGTGHHDLQTVCEMDLPPVIRGWTEVDLTFAGGPKALKEGEFIDDSDEEDYALQHSTLQSQQARVAARADRRAWRRIGTGPTLRCFLVQVRILENNQNGKDTHLRGLQLFAKDENHVFTRRKRYNASPEDRRFIEDFSAGLADNMKTGPITRARAARKTRASITAEETKETPMRSGGLPRTHDVMAELEMKFGEPELR